MTGDSTDDIGASAGGFYGHHNGESGGLTEISAMACPRIASRHDRRSNDGLFSQTASGSAASYYPETNVLVPLDSVAEISNTPTSKGVYVRSEPASGW